MAKPNNFDYSSVPEPPDGIESGTVLPASEFPDDLRCPYCEDRPKFKNSNGLRGHCNGKHGIRWDIPAPSKSLAEMRAAMPEPHERTTLKPWHMYAIAMHEVYGYSWQRVADRMERGADNLRAVAKSPAGRGMIEAVRERMDTPEKIALLLMKANTVDATVDYLMALEWAKEAKDYAAVGKMTKDLLTLAGAEDRKEEHQEEVRELHIHLDGADLDLPFITTSHQVIEAEIEDD